ncbi:YfjI family protein [Actinomadura luteofluorescens]|uniref:YfjI family protein n=1 Tax=Actinomadura luteofluorescens TaxID=46163 RepID=UPI0030D4BEC8
MPDPLPSPFWASRPGGKVWVQGPAWTEPTNLFTLVVLPPGNRKSEVYKHMTAPIRAAESILVEQAKPVIAEAVIARRVAEAHAEKTEKAAASAVDADQRAAALDEATTARLALDETAVPAEPCLFSDDATVERLTSHLSEQGGRFAILSPEGEIFSIAAGRYSGAPNFAVLKSGHAGEEMRIDRMGRASERIPAATITLGICTQPGVLTRLGETPQFLEQGLLGRLLYSVPKSLLGYRDPNPEPIPAHITDAYRANVTALILSLHALSEPATVRFAPDAEVAALDLLTETEPRFRPGTGDLAHMTDWGGKYVGAVLRIAALLHLAEHFRDGWDRPISLATFQNARQIGEYFTVHAQAAYDAIGADPAVADARALLEWIERTATTQFSARDVLSSLRRFKKVADLNPGLRILESHGWIRRIPTAPKTGRGRKAGPLYETHPDTTSATR